GFDPSPAGGDAAADAVVDTAIDAAPFVCTGRAVAGVPATGIVTGMLGSSPDDAAGSCGGGGAPDLVFGIDLASAEMSLLVAADLPGTAVDTLLHIRRDCDDPNTEVVCDLDGGAGDRAAHRLITPGAGRYHVFIDQESG